MTRRSKYDAPLSTRAPKSARAEARQVKPRPFQLHIDDLLEPADRGGIGEYRGAAPPGLSGKKLKS